MEAQRAKNFLLQAGALAAIAALFYVGFRYALPSFLPLCLGGLLAALLHPVAAGLCSRIGCGYRPCALLVAVVALLLLLGGLLWGVGGILLSQGSALFAKLPDFFDESVLPLLDRLQNWWLQVGEHFQVGTQRSAESWSNTTEQALTEAITSLSGMMLSWVGMLVTSLPTLLLTASFTVISTFMFLLDYRNVTSFIVRILPSATLRPLVESKRFLLGSVRKIVVAYLFIMVVTFGEISLGLWLLRVPYFAVIGFGIALLDMLPFIGSGLVLIPWGLLELLVRQNTALGAGLLILYGIVAVVRFWMEPRIVGGRIGLHPLATLTAMYAGLRLLGFWGFLLAPLLITLFVHLSRKGMLHPQK